MSTVPSPPTCRSCEHFLSSADERPFGQCLAWCEPTHLGNSCSYHEPKYLPENDTVLVERQCVTCEHVNLYALGFGGYAICAQCAGRSSTDA